MIYTVTLTPAVDRHLSVETLHPGLVNRVKSTCVLPGGKGINVSKTLLHLGMKSTALGILGGSTGEYIKSRLDNLGIITCFTFTDVPTRTNIKIDEDSGITTDLNEPANEVSEETLADVLDKLLGKIKPGDIAVLAGKVPINANPGIFGDWIRRIHQHGAKVALDCEGETERLALRELPDIIKPNHHELAQIMDRQLDSVPEILEAARELHRTGIPTVAVTMGENGGIFLRGNEEFVMSAEKVAVRTTVGAGDATLAGLVFAEAMGMDFPEECKLAMRCGKEAVERKL